MSLERVPAHRRRPEHEIQKLHQNFLFSKRVREGWPDRLALGALRVPSVLDVVRDQVKRRVRAEAAGQLVQAGRDVLAGEGCRRWLVQAETRQRRHQLSGACVGNEVRAPTPIVPGSPPLPGSAARHTPPAANGHSRAATGLQRLWHIRGLGLPGPFRSHHGHRRRWRESA